MAILNKTEQEYYDMYISNISRYDNFNDLKNEIMKNTNYKNISQNTIDEIEKFYNKYQRKPKYWMLISNPAKWDDGDNQHEVNNNLLSLDENSIEFWKINDRTDMELAMKAGDLGIIKVSEDTRSIKNRTDKNGEIVPILNSGIYAIFEVIKDEDGDITFENEDGNWFVNIKVIDNLFAKDKIIDKDTSMKLLGENLYKSVPSTRITKEVFDKVLDYIEKR